MNSPEKEKREQEIYESFFAESDHLKSHRSRPKSSDNWKPSKEQLCLPGIEESGIPGKDYIPVEWVDACEKYGKWKIIQQEQPEEDLKKVYDAYCKVCGHYHHTTPAHICRQVCDYFQDFKALLNARKEK